MPTELPKPMWEEPEVGSIIWILDIRWLNIVEWQFNGFGVDGLAKYIFNNGFIFDEEEKAKAVLNWWKTNMVKG